MELTFDKIYNLFENFDEHTDCYPGVMFIKIYKTVPTCYACSFNNTDKIQFTKYIEKPAVQDIKHSIDDKVLLNGFVKDENFEVIQYSPHEYMILGKHTEFMTVLTISDTSDKSLSLYLGVYISNYLTEEEINNLFNSISEYFVPIKRDDDIDFGITAVDTTGSLYTNYYDFKPVSVDIDKNYNDDIPYDKMLDILNNGESSALMLFYGEPGTGKSTLIKKFISEMPEKEFIFMDGTLLAGVQQDRLMSYFMECQDAIFIFEDCEKILMNRDNHNNPTMSILLNLTDGIISDILNIKIICTFNTSLNNIDKALLRKGRLKLKYEFKKLNKDKVSKILEGETINQDMSLADIYYYKEENDYSKKQQSRIGF